MIPLLYYALKVVVCSGIFYAYYLFALRNKLFHRWNRFYLLITVVLSLVLPLVKIHFLPSGTAEQRSGLPAVLTVVDDADHFVYTAIGTQEGASFQWTDLLPLLASLFSLLVITGFIRSLWVIRKLYLHNPKEKIQEIVLVSTTAKGTPFSFLKYIFWNRAIDLNQSTGKQILQHELVHVRHRHSWDNIFINLILCAGWLNPFFWLIRRELVTIHEFIADELSVEQQDVSLFAAMLLQVSFPSRFSSLGNPFFTSSIKRRIAMINKLRNNRKVSYISRVLVLPLAAFLFLAFSFTTRNKAENNDRITIIVDAGHGGTDKGVYSPDGKYAEADLTLQLARQVQQLAGEYNIDVVMTRIDEQFPGDAQTKTEALRKRTEMAKALNPAAFISLHMSSAGQAGTINTTVSGFGAYVSTGANAEQSKILAGTLLEQVSTLYATHNTVKQRNSKIEVLDNNPAPAVIIECGFITNEKDLAFITDKHNQEQVARKILAGVRQFHSFTKTGAVSDLAPAPSLADTLTTSAFIPGAASYPGGMNAWRRYLEKNLDPGIPAKEGWKPGNYSVLVQFTIEADGSVNHISSANYEGSQTVSHCFSTIRSAGKWIPAEKDGKTVASVYKQPFSFVVMPAENYQGVLHKDPPHQLPGEVVMVHYPLSNLPEKNVDKEASFPGGTEGWRKHLVNNLKSTLPVEEGWGHGQYTIVLNFIVKKDGTPDNITTENYAGTKVAEHCINLLKEGPKWIPAELKGKAVSSYRKQPVTFVVMEDDNKNPLPKDPVIFALKDKMNRLFTGIDNPVTIYTRQPDMQSSNLLVSNGSARKTGPGQYLIRVTTPGTATIRVVDNNNTELGQQTFSVVVLPKPGTPGYPEFINSGNASEKPLVYLVSPDETDQIRLKDLRECRQLYLKTSDRNMAVTSFRLSIDMPDGKIREYSVSGNKLTTGIINLLAEAQAGQMIIIDSIMAKSGDREIKVQAKVLHITSA